MNFQLNDIQWVNDKPSGKGKTKVSGAAITIQKNGKNVDGSVRQCNCLSISGDLMKETRLRVGDKVVIGVASVDGKKFIVVRRSDDNGHAISKPSKQGAETGYVKFSYTTGQNTTLAFQDEVFANYKDIHKGDFEFYWEVK